MRDGRKVGRTGKESLSKAESISPTSYASKSSPSVFVPL